MTTTQLYTNGINGPRPTLKDLNFMLASSEDTSSFEPIEETAEPGEQKARRFPPMTLASLLKLPPKEYIINQVLGAGDLAVIYGPPGCGKTFVVVDLIFCACLGKQWAMRFDIPEPLNVAYCAGEGVSGLPGRFAAAAQRYGVTDLPSFTFFPLVPALHYEDGQKSTLDTLDTFIGEWQERQEACEVGPLDILIIDTLHSATAGADENSARDMGAILDKCRRAKQALGCAVVLIHHSNRAGTGERGSSALRGAADLMIRVDAGDKNHTMTCDKLKDGEQWIPQEFSLVAMADSVRVWWELPESQEQKDERKSETAKEILKVLSEATTPKTAKQISDALGIKQQNFNSVKRRLVKQLLVSSDDSPGYYVFAITDAGREALNSGSEI